jgi:hypothetical protein
MSRRIWLPAIVVAALGIAGCGGRAYLNPNYRGQVQGQPKLAIVPVLPASDPLATQVDDAFAKAFRDKDRPELLIPPMEVRATIAKDQTLLKTLGAFQSAEYSSNEKKRGASILATINQDDLNHVRGAVRDADFLLVPRDWRVNAALGHTFGACTFRLYDLKTGQLVYERSNDLNVNVTGAAGMLSAVLISDFVYDDYKKMVLSKIR